MKKSQWVNARAARIRRKMDAQPSVAAVRRCVEREILGMRREVWESVPDCALQPFAEALRIAGEKFIAEKFGPEHCV